MQNLQSDEIKKLIAYLTMCSNNNLLLPEQEQMFRNLLLQQGQPENMKDAPLESESEPDQASLIDNFPSNCRHIRVCYLIWNQNNRGVDPTEFARRIKRVVMRVF